MSRRTDARSRQARSTPRRRRLPLLTAVAGLSLIAPATHLASRHGRHTIAVSVRSEPKEGLAQASPWMERSSHTTASLRGLAVARDGSVWASGARGTYLRSDDGTMWTTDSVPGAAPRDFRGVAAVNRTTAVLAVAAQDTAQIYRTSDGGRTWTIVYDDTRRGAFLDAIAFWDGARGIALGDPMDGAFLVLLTADSGAHWTRARALPASLVNEGAFAASNSCLTTGSGGTAWFATGGASVSRVFYTSDFGRSWSVAETPIPAGNGASGIFSLAFRDRLHGIAVGGDYAAPDSVRPNIAITNDGGHQWTLADSARFARFLSGVVYAGSGTAAPVVAVGTRGSWVSRDAGLTWSRVAVAPYNAVVWVQGTAIAVGPQGAVGTWAVGGP
jgi:photosystem II stability/assembly factor-like uncharacterized protein